MRKNGKYLKMNMAGLVINLMERINGEWGMDKQHLIILYIIS